VTAWESRGPVEAKPDLSAISSTRKSATYAAALKTLDKLEEEPHVGDDYLIMATDYPHANDKAKDPMGQSSAPLWHPRNSGTQSG
jgi:hypothetical protein